MVYFNVGKVLPRFLESGKTLARSRTYDGQIGNAI